MFDPQQPDDTLSTVNQLVLHADETPTNGDNHPCVLQIELALFLAQHILPAL